MPHHHYYNYYYAHQEPVVDSPISLLLSFLTIIIFILFLFRFAIAIFSLLLNPHLPPLLRPCTPPPMSSSSLASTPDPVPSKTVRVVIKRRVQGVFYRNWTIENARELGLKGWVRNRRGGSVEALFSGSDEKVAEMEQRCRRGPPEAIVTGLDVFPCTDDPGTGFERRPTV